MRLDTFVYKTVDGCEVRADIYRPADAQRRPALVWIHGGALILGSRLSINPRQRDRYLAAGFAVVAIDYRLAPETRLPAIVDDLRDAIAWVATDGTRLAALDPDRLVVVGHSAGGYLTLLSGYAVQPRPRALVSFYGYGDILGDWYRHPDPFYCQQPRVTDADARAAVGTQPLTGADGAAAQTRARFYLWCRQQGRWPREVVGVDPDTEPGAFDAFCPVRHVTSDYPPTLLLHGDRDTDVPYAQSVQMAEALSRAGVEHELMTITGGGHGFDRTMDEASVEDTFERVLNFLSRHVVAAGGGVPRDGTM
jgi:acetyl esterase/lipase